MTERTKEEQIEKLMSIKEAAQGCLDALADIRKAIEPGIMNSGKVNMILEHKQARDYREKTDAEIKFYQEALACVEIELKKQQGVVEEITEIVNETV